MADRGLHCGLSTKMDGRVCRESLSGMDGRVGVVFVFSGGVMVVERVAPRGSGTVSLGVAKAGVGAKNQPVQGKSHVGGQLMGRHLPLHAVVGDVNRLQAGHAVAVGADYQ